MSGASPPDGPSGPVRGPEGHTGARDRRLPLPAPPARMLGRALLRRCPVCGANGVFRSWLVLREACPRCAMPFTREEGYWLGAVIVNILAAQAVLFAFVMGGVALALPDEPPWAVLLVGGLALMIVVPTLGYPLTKQLWLWIDLVVNPRGDAAAAAREAAQRERGNAAGPRSPPGSSPPGG